MVSRLLGIVGSGQLGKMLGLAAIPLGYTVRFFDQQSGPAASVGEVIVGDYNDQAALQRFAQGLTAVTYEFENVPVAAAEFLARLLPVYPPPLALETGQDRWHEKSFFKRLGIPTAPFAAIESLHDLQNAVEKIGLPGVLKTRRLGYDGKGQAVIKKASDITAAWQSIKQQPAIYESFVKFDREVSILAVRDQNNNFVFYPLVENHHRDGILRLTLAPAPKLQKPLQRAAEKAARLIMDELDYIGVLAIEFFVAKGKLIANEMAPRVHNSGHWSIEGAETSQFENHVRAVLGLPLGSPVLRGHSAMINIIGTFPERQKLLAHAGLHLHDYAKTPQLGRKLGHMTLCCKSPAALKKSLKPFDPRKG